MSNDLYDELILGDARGGRKPTKPVAMTMTRELTDEDIMALAEGSAPAAPQQTTILSIRHSHHQLARLIAGGETNGEISLLTGYSPAYVSKLKADPTFQELVKHYESRTADIFVDVQERAKQLGLSAIDELHRRLEENPESWKIRELLELTESMLGKASPVAPQNGGASAGASEINITFISGDQMTKQIPPDPIKTLDLDVVPSSNDGE